MWRGFSTFVLSEAGVYGRAGVNNPWSQIRGRPLIPRGLRSRANPKGTPYYPYKQIFFIRDHVVTLLL